MRCPSTLLAERTAQTIPRRMSTAALLPSRLGPGLPHLTAGGRRGPLVCLYWPLGKEVKMKTNQTEASKTKRERLATQKELAALLRVSARTIRRLTRSGSLPCVQVGRRLPRYRVGDVLHALSLNGVVERGEEGEQVINQ